MTATTSGVRWRYVAADAAGAPVSGEIEAASEREAIDALRRRSLWVTTLTPSSNASRDVGAAQSVNSVSGSPMSSGATSPRWWPQRTGASARDLAIVTRAMATLLSAGVPLDRALAFAVSQAPDDASRQSFTRVRDAVRNGQSLASAITRDALFPSYFAPTIAAGEASGTLSAALVMLADHVERSDAVRRRLQGALVYPAILGLASVVGVTVIMLLVVPRFAGMIEESGGTLPTSTRLLIAASAAVTRGWWIALLLAMLSAVLWRRAMNDSSWRRRVDAAVLRWPVVGRLLRTRAAAGYAGTLAVALRSGVPLLSSMALARAVVPNSRLNDDLAAAELRVRDGGTLAGGLTGVLPPLAVRLLEAGEAGGDLPVMASRAAEAAEGDVQGAVTKAVTLLEPVLILGFGGVVGFVALALLQAIYGINARTL